MILNYLINVLEKNKSNEAIIWKGERCSYQKLLTLIEFWIQRIDAHGIAQGDVIALQGDYSPNTIALFIALTIRCCIVSPITTRNKVEQAEYIKVAEAGWLIEVSSNDEVVFNRLDGVINNSLLKEMQGRNHPGLIIFSSGSTGKFKAAVHDLFLLIKKFQQPKKCARVIAFLLFDHIGGINTLFYTLFNGGCLIIPEDRTPQYVCEAIEKFKATALTTSPTFLNLLILSGMSDRYDLNSLQVINYSSEIMPENTLIKLRNIFPTIRLSQAYGLTEVGVLPVKSKSSDSLFIKLDNSKCETRIVNGVLEIKVESSMLGYLNAPQPFTTDGWFITGDAVEIDGEYLRILGRKSELINVGGEKVYPAEIETILEQIDGVEQATVYSEKNVISGQIVVANIKLTTTETLVDFRPRLFDFCKSRLPKYKIPQKIMLSHSKLHNERFKKIRKQQECVL